MNEDAGYQTPVLMLAVDESIGLGAETYQCRVVGGHQGHASRHPHQKEDAKIEADEYERKRAGACEERSYEIDCVDALSFGEYRGQRPESAVYAICVIGRSEVAATGAASESWLIGSLIQSVSVSRWLSLVIPGQRSCER